VIGAAAALAGLIFVAVSLNAEDILNHPRLPSLAARSLALLLSLMVMSAFVLAPASPGSPPAACTGRWPRLSAASPPPSSTPGSCSSRSSASRLRADQTAHMIFIVPKSIAVFGAGPGLGQAVARRYAREGYAVTLVARHPEPLDRLAQELTSAGATAHVVTADLADTAATPRLAEQIRARAGELDALYYAPTPATGFVAAADLTPQRAEHFMPLIFYTMLALVQEFLPHMLEQGDGAILTAQGGSTVLGLPNMSGPSPAQAAQRNYLQALHAEVAGQGVYVGMLYVGAAIRDSAFHTEMEAARAAGHPVWDMPVVDPEHLAGLLWSMHAAKGEPEAIYP
jgi:short-subunit dehydrogenase